MKLTKKQNKIIAVALASWGILLIGSGTIMSSMDKPKKKENIKLRIVQKRVANIKSNEIKPKDIEVELDQTLSVNVKDYLQNPDDIEEKIISSLKLDTSMINISQSGTYTYTITYKKKKFSARYTVKAKELPNVTMTLKNLNLEVGSSLSTDIQTYVVENLSKEVKDNSVLNISGINTTQSGNYQYTITYNNKLYTGTVTIYQPQIIKNETPTNNNNQNNNNNTNNENDNNEPATQEE